MKDIRRQAGVTVATMLLIVALDAHAQAYKAGRPEARAVTGGATDGILRIREFTGFGPRALVRTPEFTSTASRGRNEAKNWDEIAVTFDSDPEWIDEITFQFYALLHERISGDYTLLKGTVTVVDVARGRNHMAAAYIRPSTLARHGVVVAVAAEVIVKGEVVKTVSDGRLPKAQALPADWWKSSKLVPLDGSILSKSQTPFAVVNYDDYEVSK